MNNKENILNSIAAAKLSELMKKVNVYVEVRTDEDNRSEGIKKVISSLGAKINNRITKNTTHVIFKDGLLSTYKKAKQLNIPLVSILWIEACKKQFKLADPSQFPISNIDRYEFPEMYDKMKRIKNMQPDAVDKKKRLSTLKQSNKKNVESPIVEKIKPPRVPRTPKDNLQSILSEFQEKILSTPDNNESIVFKSKLLQKIKETPTTPKTDQIMNESNEFSDDIFAVRTDKNSNGLPVPLRESSRVKKANAKFINDMFVQTTEKPAKRSYRRRTVSSINLSKENGKSDISSYFTPVHKKKIENVLESEGFKTPSQESNENILDLNSNNICVKDSNPRTEIGIKGIANNDITPLGKQINGDSRKTLYNYTPQNVEFSNTFNSARKACNNRRRTLFDISLDIIDKGLRTINQQAKVNETIIEEVTIAEQSNKNSDQALHKIATASIDDKESTPGVKRRKLFLPEQFQLTPTAEFNKMMLSSNKRIREPESPFLEKKIDKKRGKTINALAPTLDKSNRRTSFYFPTTPLMPKPLEKRTVTEKPKVLVCTNMYKEQTEFVEKAIKSLGGFEIAKSVNEKTTHVLSLENRRTINIIKGIVCGLWVLKYEWIIDSFNKGNWLCEELYEFQEFSRSVQICRAERQTLGSPYRMAILSGFPSIYVSNKCKVPVDSLKEIIRLCSGQLVNDPKKCEYFIGDYYEGKICVQPQWILDSITSNQIMKPFKYTIKPNKHVI